MKLSRLLTVFCVVLLGAWALGGDEPPATNPSETNNVAPEGFALLFNGKDLAGWKGLVGNPILRGKMSGPALVDAQKKPDEEMRKHWRVENGELVNDGHGPNLCTAKPYGDFEMWVDWKIKPKGDSGIYLRGSPQVQIWDPENLAEKSNGADKGSGGLWNNKTNARFPLVRADNPIGQWNTFYIKMVGERVTVKLNGKLVTDNVVMENYWERAKPIYSSEQIELQFHGSETRFRNIYIKELTAETTRPSTQPTP